jgi:LysM repeat protein
MNTPSKPVSYLVIAVCILAVISLILGTIALRGISSMKNQIGDVGGFAARLDAIEISSRKASDDSRKAVSRIATLGSDTQRAFDNVNKELATLRTSVNRLTIEMRGNGGNTAEGGSRSSSSSSTAKQPPLSSSGSTSLTPSTGSQSPAPTGDLDSDITYTIKAGDTFARLSGQLGVSVQAIEAANPGVDPRRLRIGQKVFIPTDP